MAMALVIGSTGTCEPGLPSVGGADPPSCGVLKGPSVMLVDVYGWALLAGLGVAAAGIVAVMALPAPGEREALRWELLASVMARIRARAAVLPRVAAAALTATSLVFIVGGTAAFLDRAPVTVQRWCTNLPAVPDERCDDLPGADGADEPHAADDEAAWLLTDTAAVRVAHSTLYGVLGFMILNLVKSRALFAALRRIGSVWDIVTFWPRAFHPFAVRSYAERAVPELQRLFVNGVERAPGPIQVLAHSQGSVLSLAALAPLLATGTNVHVDRLVTVGSPIRTLYAQAFPAYVNEELIEAVHRPAREPWRWENAFRFTDHVGRAVFIDDGGWRAAPDASGVGQHHSTDGDIALTDPWPAGQPVAGHNRYWTDSRVERIVRRG